MNGPGAMMMNGPGPGMMMNGPGAMGANAMMMNGPGPGMMMNGPGMMMNGPGMGFNMSAGMNYGGGLPAIPNNESEEGLPSDCAKCGEPITGIVVRAMGSCYHQDHFVCEYCSQPFPNGRFVKAPDGNLYCEQDFAELFAKRCKVCNEVIVKEVVNVDGMCFHPEHFICVGCGTNLVKKKFKAHAETKQIYCPTCLPPDVRLIKPEAHICAQCALPIQGPYLLIKGQYMHPRHFRCHECGEEFKGGDCNEFEGDYYCGPHYAILLLKKCARCGKPCKGRSVTALGKVWHPDHFVCHICAVPFVESNFFENDGLPYCQTHYIQLFGDNCAFCKEPILKGAMRFLEKAYHEEHFLCSQCNKPLKSGKFTAWDSKAICMPCYGSLPPKLKKQVENRMKQEKKAQMARVKEQKDAEKAEQKEKKGKK
jgi:hypothetical protein